MTIRHRPKIIHNDPEARTSGDRHQIGTPAGIGSERLAAFKSVRVAGAIGIRTFYLLDPAAVMHCGGRSLA
ncbi:MAG TPA: hypothetical protein VMM81_08465 [Acidimicrobiia bacterium]|nr:hypothetical protein [Acidimicrobiia bacterium]